MQKRIVISKGKKYVVNVVGWEDGIGSGVHPGVFPFITSQPSSINSTIGSSVDFTVVAGPLPQYNPAYWIGYQWYFNGVPLVDNSQITGSNSATLHINNLIGVNEGDYYVYVTNDYGYITSSMATLIIVSSDVWETNPNNWEKEVELWEIA